MKASRNSRAFVLPDHLSTGAEFVTQDRYFLSRIFFVCFLSVVPLLARALWYIKKGRTKTIVKFEDAGSGGLNDLRSKLDENKVVD